MESPIQEFYKDKSIFLTGASGFLGQIIIEKLLRCCDVNIIYILVRNKKGKSWQNRVQQMCCDPLYDTVRKEKPNFMDKLIGVVGDCTLPDFGLSIKDREMLFHSVNIVIHAAATVRFDEKLSTAMNINVKGTYMLLKLCKEMYNLKAFVYISTAYSNCNHFEIDEAFYKPKITAMDMIHLMDYMDEELLNSISADLIKGFPNTYVYTKHLAENLIKEYSSPLPAVVFRPSIVMPTFQEPVSGWINNLYGPIGLIYGVSMGVIHSFTADRDAKTPLIPVDMTINALLAAAWDIARNTYQSIPVYNFTPKNNNSITWGKFTDLSFAASKNFPVSKSYWYYAFELHNDIFKAKVLHYLYHIVPAIFVDAILTITGQKLRLMRVYKKIGKLSEVLSFFSLNTFTWDDNNVVELWNKMNSSDREKFFFDMGKLNWNSYIEKSLLGMRLYLVKDDPSTIPYSIKRQKVLKVIHYSFVYTIRGIGLFLVTWMFLRIYFSIMLPLTL